jgi:putative ABC transport system substrate-binding protein
MIIVSTPAMQPAKAATATIPIVFVSADDPVRLGLVASFNRPGGNATGVYFLIAALEAKRAQLVHELVPKADTIALSWTQIFPAQRPSRERCRRPRRRLDSICSF